MREVDVAIIGAGTAGLSARREVAKETNNYVVIDNGELGTTCARVGCMPSKVLIQVAEDFHRRQELHKMGIHGGDNLSVDIPSVMKHVRALRDRFVSGVLKDIDSWQKKHLIRKRAKFIDKNTLDLGDEKIRAKKIIIATGSRPIVPKSFLAHKDYLLDTDYFFEQENFPKRIAVVGLGVIGIELGQALHRLGIEVVGINLGKMIGGITDPDVQNYIWEHFSKEMEIAPDGAEIVGPTDDGIKIKSGNKEWVVDKIILAMGRRPNVDNMGLENIGVKLNQLGVPEYEENIYRLKGDLPIYIAGDVLGVRPLLHEAADEGRIAGYNAVRESDQCFARRVAMGVVFCHPNIASIGKNFQQLKEEKADFVTGSVSFEGQGRSIVKMANKGLLNVYGCRSTGKLLGAEIFAPDGEHLAHLINWMIALNQTVFQVLSLPFYHPVVEEGLRTALRNLAQKTDQKPPVLEVLRCQDVIAGGENCPK